MTFWAHNICKTYFGREPKMSKKMYLCIVCVLFAFSFACGDDEPSAAQEIDSTLAEYEKVSEDHSKDFCVCYADLFFEGNMNQCVRDQQLGEILPTACERKVAECYVDEFTVYLRCS